MPGNIFEPNEKEIKILQKEEDLEKKLRDEEKEKANPKHPINIICWMDYQADN